MFINYLSLPAIPHEMLEDLDTIKNKPFSEETPFKRDSKFRLKDVDSKLHEYLKTIFPFDILCRYQFVYDGIPIHADYKDDVGRKYAINYLLDCGGNNVVTNIYNSDKQLIESKCIESKRWHVIHTDQLHDVKNINPQSVRIALSVGELDNDNHIIEKFLQNFGADGGI